MGSTCDPQMVATGPTDRLMLFGIKGFQELKTNQSPSTWVRMPGRDQAVLASAGLSFQDPTGRLIAVLSHRKDGLGLPRLRSDAAAHTFYALLRSRGEPVKGPRWPDGWGTPAVPRVDWEPASIPLDSQPTDFEICQFDGGYWSGIGRAPEADITLMSFGVPMESLELERVGEVTKRPPPFPPAQSARLRN